MKSSTHSSDRDSQGTVGSDMSIRKGVVDLSATGSEEALNRSNDVRLGSGPDPEQVHGPAPVRAQAIPVTTAQPRAQDPAAPTPPLPQPVATSRSPSKPAVADETLSTASDLAAAAHQQREQRQNRRSSRQSAGSSARPSRSRGQHHHHTTVEQRPSPPAVPYVPYGYQDYRPSASTPYADHEDDYEYHDGRGPPPCSRRWRRIKRVLTLLSMAWAGVILSLACLFAAQGGVADSVGVWSIPIAIAALVWNSAELLVYAARARGVAPAGPTGRGAARGAVAGRAGVRRGIHPGAHVGLHLCFWLACALSIYLTMMVYQDVQNTMADCAAAAATPGSGGPNDHCQAAYHYTSNLHLFRQGFYSPSLRALLAMFGLATLTHFALFVRACIEVDRRNRARFAAADEEEYAASTVTATATIDDGRPGAGAPAYGMVETGGPWTWVQPPDYHHSSGGRRQPTPGLAGSQIVTMYDEGSGSGGGPPLPDAAPGAGGATKERV